MIENIDDVLMDDLASLASDNCMPIEAQVHHILRRAIPSGDRRASAAGAAKLSMTLDHSVYDCAYPACAASLGVPLVTAHPVFAATATAKHADGLVHVLGSA